MCLVAEPVAPSSTSFVIHAGAALLALWGLNFMIASYVPVAIQQIESSFWIFFYHFPSAINCYLFFTTLMVCAVGFLATRDPRWDQHGRVAGEIGVLAVTITLVTGSCWARMAWGQWWIWDDPRLLSVAIMWATYAGYLMLQYQVEDTDKRRRWTAVYAVLAWINLPIVHYSIQWLGSKSHPQKFQDLSSTGSIVGTRWFGVFAFLVLYSLIYRWKLARDRVHDEAQAILSRVRHMEEGAVS